MCVYSVASTDKSDSNQYPEVLNEAMVCLMLEDPLSCSLLFSVSSSVTLQIGGPAVSQRYTVPAELFTSCGEEERSEADHIKPN